MSLPSPHPKPVLRRAAPRTLPLLALACALALLAGCVQDAEMKVFKCRNPNDPKPSDNCDKTAASAGTGTITIALLDSLHPETIVLVNMNSATAVNMTDWTLVNGDTVPAVRYKFLAFTLQAGAYVRVHEVTGTDTFTDLFGAKFSWGATGGDSRAVLRNDLGTPVSECQSTDTTTCWQ